MKETLIGNKLNCFIAKISLQNCMNDLVRELEADSNQADSLFKLPSAHIICNHLLSVSAQNEPCFNFTTITYPLVPEECAQ